MLNAPGHGRRREDGSYEPEKIYPSGPMSGILVETEEGNTPIFDAVLFGVLPAYGSGKILYSMGRYWLIDESVNRALSPFMDEYDEGILVEGEPNLTDILLEMPDGSHLEVEIGGTYNYGGIEVEIIDTGEVDSSGYPIIEARQVETSTTSSVAKNRKFGGYNPPLAIALAFALVYFLNNRNKLNFA